MIGGATNNGNFETPDVTGETQISGGTITNWSTWTDATSNTGVYDSRYLPVGSGSQVVFIQRGAIKNTTSYFIQAGDVFTYGFTDVVSNRGNAMMQLLYNNGGVFTGITGSDLLDSGTTDNFPNSRTFTVQPGDAWIGSSVGVGLSGNNYPELDDVNLSVVPEPSSAMLGGLGALALLRRRRA